MNMEKPELYIRSNIPSETDTITVLEKIKNMIVWKDNCNILDIGCGPGEVTYYILLPFLPKNANSIIGIDKQEDIIHYAKETYGKISNIKFEKADIVFDKIILKKYKETFDHIFSFYCFHFIGKQDVALENIFKVLKPGGDFFFILAVNCNLFALYEHISKMEKWDPLMPDCHKFLSPYKESSNPLGDLALLLSDSGLQILHLSIESKEVLFGIKTAKDFLISHNPIKLPEHLQADFGLTCLDVLREKKWNYINEHGEEFYPLKYQMIFAHVRKPQ